MLAEVRKKRDQREPAIDKDQNRSDETHHAASSFTRCRAAIRRSAIAVTSGRFPKGIRPLDLHQEEIDWLPRRLRDLVERR